MGILTDALSIILGGFFGDVFKKSISFKNVFILGISIMLISLVGFLENMFNIVDMKLESTNLMIVIFSLIIGCWIGGALKIDEKLSKLAMCENTSYNAFVDAALFFGVGGLQISGPVLLAINNDNSQLVLKSIIDFPFALMFGMSYGKIVAFSSFPVAVVQMLIAVSAYFAGSFLSDVIVRQLCAMGYIVLFFSGFNLICENKHKINNCNMLPGIFIIIILNLLMYIRRLII